jgi:hypothetical protein
VAPSLAAHELWNQLGQDAVSLEGRSSMHDQLLGYFRSAISLARAGRVHLE